MIQTIILLAGEGRRFKEADYKEDKPFIPIHGRPMISLVRKNLERWANTPKQKFIPICRKSHEVQVRGLFHPLDSVVTVNELTQGAACTALLAKNLINSNDELIIANCDQLVLDENFIDYFYKHMQYTNADGGIACFLADHPKWSFARVQNGLITEVAEKNPISPLATCGIYYFRRGSDFVRCAERMIEKNDRVKGEFYLCPVYNYLIAEGKRVLPFMVNQFQGLGTPEDLQSYLNRGQ